jgi:hypothetical protein
LFGATTFLRTSPEVALAPQKYNKPDLQVQMGVGRRAMVNEIQGGKIACMEIA